MNILKFLLYLSLPAIVAGPLLMVPIAVPGVNIYLLDLVMGLIGLVWLTRLKELINILKEDKICRSFFFFILVCSLSLAASPLPLSLQEKVVSGLYLARLIDYFLLYPTVLILIKTKKITSKTPVEILVLAGLILAIFGWLQYFFYPDLRNLYYLGWDPHYKRIFSTLLDPNFLGLLLVLLLIITCMNFKFSRYMSFFLFLTLMFTYSRSSYLALGSSVFYYSFVKKKWAVFGGLIVIFLIMIFLLPRTGGESVKLERVFSIDQRIETWKEAGKIFLDHPLLGVGYNTARFAKKNYLETNHAGAGFDNSFLFIAATTGITGLLAYLLFLKQCFQQTSLAARISLAAIIVHALFLNSLFFAWVMWWFWLVLASFPRLSEHEPPGSSN